jgi:hypothetical protein
MQQDQKRSNQYIKRREEAENAETIRRKIKTGILISRLTKASKGKVELSRSQLDATKILLDKALPSLQAVETTHVEVTPTPEEATAALTHMLLANPVLLRPALTDPGFRAALQSMLDGAPIPVAQQQAHKAA